MNENIDLTKILEGLEGIELWSSLVGEKCILKQICPQNKYDCIVLALKGDEKKEYSFKKDGSYGIPGNGECLIFPSKDQRDWSKFKRPPKKGDFMVCNNTLDTACCNWILCPYVGFRQGRHYAATTYTQYIETDFDYMIPWKKFNPYNIKECVEKYNIQ